MNEEILLQTALHALGFLEASGFNPRYYPLETFESLPSASHFSRVARRISASIHDDSGNALQGAYFLGSEINKSEPPKPIVFVARATTEEDARSIHENLWNLGSIAFIIIILPWEIRVCTGFDYDRDKTSQGVLDQIYVEQAGLFLDQIALVSEVLRKYSAEAVDDGSIWSRLQESDRFNYENRVDKRLLRSLRQLEAELLERLLKKDITKPLEFVHSIIGKFVYLRYLYDRGILTPEWAAVSEVDLDKVLGRGATVEQLKKLDAAIETRFGGSVFPFPKGFETVYDNELVSYVASVFKGDEPVGDRQPMLFDVYNFSYIPVEMLSYIYEQFLRAQGKTKEDGAVYTPTALADYLINEVSTVTPLNAGMKILDPCCGSGIFLVLTYRYLIELKLKNSGEEKLSPATLRSILERCIYGVELNLEACHVTEFSLILVLLNYVEPPDLNKNKRFRFPRLLGKNIFQGNFFDPNREFYPLKMSFDWIIGNPPWKGVNALDNPDEVPVRDWIKSNAERFPVGSKRIEEAFAWRALEFVSESGCIGFVLTAKRLFNTHSKRFRQAFFSKTYTRRITNFSNFHYLFFPADVSPMTMIYQRFRENRLPIWHYGPFAANQLAAKVKTKPVRPIWTISLNKSEVKFVPQQIAELGDMLTWKTAFWGSYEDEKVITRLRNTFDLTVDDLCDQQGWELLYGIQLRTDPGSYEAELPWKQEAVRPLHPSLFSDEGTKVYELDPKVLNRLGVRYHIPDMAIREVPKTRWYFRVRGGTAGEALIAPPHVVINPNYSIFSDEEFVIGDQSGIAGLDGDEDVLRALAMYLGSDIGRYLMFFHSPEWGIDRTKIDKAVVRDLPVPNFTARQIRQLADLQRYAQESERDYYSKIGNQLRDLDTQVLFGQPEISDLVAGDPDLSKLRKAKEFLPVGVDIRELAARVEISLKKIVGLPEMVGVTVSDFLSTTLTLNKGKVSSTNTQIVPAIENPSVKALSLYAKRLRSHLDDFAGGEGIRHLVSLIQSSRLTVCQVTPVFTKDQLDVMVTQAKGEWADKLETIETVLQERFSQWLYFQRELRVYDESGKVVSICKPSRLIDWTRTKAMSDANDIISHYATFNAKVVHKS